MKLFDYRLKAIRNEELGMKNFSHFPSPISLFPIIAAILRKDFLIGMRRRATFAAMMMFALTAVASLSLSTGGTFVEPKFLAALLWVVIFFAASAGISGTFDDEAAAGTLPTLKLYADAQAILFGKMIYVFLSLIALTAFILPIFLILFDIMSVTTVSSLSPTFS